MGLDDIGLFDFSLSASLCESTFPADVILLWFNPSTPFNYFLNSRYSFC
jgi:hypothetical protein